MKLEQLLPKLDANTTICITMKGKELTGLNYNQAMKFKGMDVVGFWTTSKNHITIWVE